MIKLRKVEVRYYYSNEITTKRISYSTIDYLSLFIFRFEIRLPDRLYRILSKTKIKLKYVYKNVDKGYQDFDEEKMYFISKTKLWNIELPEQPVINNFGQNSTTDVSIIE